MTEGLSLTAVSASYGAALAIEAVSLAVKAGEVVALLGRNGAGKSSTLKAAMGMIALRSGKIELDGIEISGRPVNRIALHGLGYVPEERRIFTGLTVRENLVCGRQSRKSGLWNEEQLFRLFPNLSEARDRLGGQLSGGEQQMLTVARTLMGNPKILLLDEPSEGLAPVIVEAMGDAVRQIRDAGVGILLCEQNLSFTRKVADRAVIIESGSLQYEGTIAALDLDETTRKRYLAV